MSYCIHRRLLSTCREKLEGRDIHCLVNSTWVIKKLTRRYYEKWLYERKICQKIETQYFRQPLNRIFSY